MFNWKKAISTGLTATMLASLLATAAVGTALAAAPTCSAGFTHGPYGTQLPYCTDATSRPADGASFITLDFVAPAASLGFDFKVVVTTSAGTFTGGTGDFASASIAGTYPATSVTIPSVTGAIATDSTLELTAPATAGTANVTVSYVPLNNATLVGGVITPPNGVAIVDSITSFTFTGATSTTVSTSYSSTSLSASSAPATAGAPGIVATTVVADTNNNPVLVGATVTWTLSGPAVFAGTAAASASAAAVAAACPSGTGTCGVATSPGINSTGVAGAVTVATTVSYLNVTYTLASKTITFYGPPAKVVLSNEANSLDDGNPASAPTLTLANGDQALLAVVTDAAGNPIKSGVTFAAGAYSPANIFNLDIAGSTYHAAGYDADAGGWLISVVCVTSGTATVTVTATVGTTTVTSNAATLTCADPLSSTAQGTFTFTSAASTVAPNGNVSLSATVKDDNGLPAPDGTPVTAVTNGVGNVVNSSGALNSGTTSNGVAKFTYLAPANAGSATITAFVANTTTGSAAVTITIGAGAPSTGIFAPTMSALGNTTVGPFSFATKIQAKGGYITWKVDGGAALAGKTIQVWVYKKYSATGAWAGPTMLTTRVANASGVAYINILSRGVLWLSLRPVLPAEGTAVAVWGPTSIGRWR